MPGMNCAKINMLFKSKKKKNSLEKSKGNHPVKYSPMNMDISMQLKIWSSLGIATEKTKIKFKENVQIAF